MINMNEMSVIDFYKYYQTKNDFRIIDVRDPDEYDSYHIHNSLNIPSSLIIDKHHLFINKNQKYFIICYNGTRSKVVAMHLNNLGYNTVNVIGGIEKWPGLLVASQRFKF